MGSATKPARKKFRVAVSGATVDGREISAEHLKTAAANYDPGVYGARVNIEHFISAYPSSELSAMGDVTALSTEEITEGLLKGRTALYAEIEPSERMKKLTDEGKKIYSSIELHPQFAANGSAYIVGLAMTDNPASLGTDRLKFAAQQRSEVMKFNNQQGEAPMFTDAIEAELIELAEQRSDEGKHWFSRVMGIIGKGRQSDGEQFSQVRDAIENIAESQADNIDRLSTLEKQHREDHQQIEKLTSDLNALTGALKVLDNNPEARFTATGGTGVQLADC